MNQYTKVFGYETLEKQGLDAAMLDRVEDLEQLVRVKGLSVNASIQGESLLHRAAHYGAARVVGYLIQSGADVEARTKNGWTPLHFAAVHGQALIVEVLLRAGANPNVHDNFRGLVTREVRKRMEDIGFSPLALARRMMERAGHPDHQRYDHRGGDVYWRIEQILFGFGAKEFIPTVPGRWGQSVRYAIDDSDVEKGELGIPLSEAEKDWIIPSRTDPEVRQFRQMYEEGFHPFIDESTSDSQQDPSDTQGGRGAQGLGTKPVGARGSRSPRQGMPQVKPGAGKHKRPKLEL
mmetsp:Transcript_48449/g.75655  ORF Transcript_48449/g.75655 Transcript_48449/m.75655 type:complete len:292 (-) Transcript_48449:236-1111(-)